MDIFRRNKAFLFFSVCVLMGAALKISFNNIGSYVDTQGFLVEPFWMIPMSFASLLIGLSGVLIILARRSIMNPKF